MKEEVKVAAVQMNIEWLNPKKNVEKMREVMRRVTSEERVDLIVFPELANSGYLKGRDKVFGREYIKCAESIPGPTTEALGEEAKRSGVYTVVGILEAHPIIPATLYNSAVLIGPTGKVLGVHHKMHIPAEEKHYFYPGDTAEVYKTNLGNIGIMVCYDLIFPELARIMSLKGAEIICGIFNTPKTEPCPLERLKYLAATRAYENKVFVIACNRVGVEDDNIFFGHSAIVAPSGEVLAYAETAEEEILKATLRAQLLIEERIYQPVYRDRRPGMYSLICSPY